MKVYVTRPIPKTGITMMTAAGHEVRGNFRATARKLSVTESRRLRLRPPKPARAQAGFV